MEKIIRFGKISRFPPPLFFSLAFFSLNFSFPSTLLKSSWDGGRRGSTARAELGRLCEGCKASQRQGLGVKRGHQIMVQAPG